MVQQVKLTEAQCEVILQEALEAANQAAKTSSEDMYCGFAWVKIRPATGSFVKYLKKKGIGDKAWNGGWDIWSSQVTDSMRVRQSQSMTLKENVCWAFADVLQKHGIKAYGQSRAD